MFVFVPSGLTIKSGLGNWLLKNGGASIVAVLGVVYSPHDLRGLIAHLEGERVGFITYHIEGDSCEIVTLASTRPSIGVGTALIQGVREVALGSRCRRLWLITTNDNVNALRFYQKRGFMLVTIHRNALEASRKVKPEISLIGSDGIPLRDEIELEMMMDNDERS